METTNLVQSITDEQIAEIEELANKATKGQWCTDGADWVCSADSDQLNNGFVLGICEGPDALSNASYMAAASAESVLALISRLRAAERELRLWSPIIDEVHRRAGKECCLEDQCDFTVTVAYEDYAAIDTAMKGDQQ